MNLLENKLYMDDIYSVTNLQLPWEKLYQKTLMISGASGMIGSFLIDVLMNKDDLKCKVIALGRDKEKAKKRFYKYWNSDLFDFVVGDINEDIKVNADKVDFIVHAASNTHPIAYSTDPIGTITTNIIGTNNLLKFATEHFTEKFLFLSSNEIYGENRSDVEKFHENYCGYINCNTMRAGYPESKRCGEALCQAYIRQKNIDVIIARLTRSFGPTLQESDTKALSQFLHRGIEGKDIILKSEGNQYYSYTYVADAVSGVLTVLLKGKCGEAYNVSSELCDIRLKDLASMVARVADTKVIFELPDIVESEGYSKATKARLDGHKIKNELDWHPNYNIEQGINRTIMILKNKAVSK